MTGPEHDAELEAFLKRRSPIHRRLSEMDHAEPPPELDRLVLNRAREAIEAQRQPLFRHSRWALPAGLAAGVLIAFAVVLNVDHDHAKVASNASPAAEGVAPAPAAARPAAFARRAAPSAGKQDPAGLSAQSSSSSAAADMSGNPHSSPEAWVREIDRLRAAGRSADAERELAAFREAYPTHPAYSVGQPPAR